jgi:hypothetical protein
MSTINIVERINGTIHRQYTANSGAQQELVISPERFLQFGAGEHTLEVTATNPAGSTTRTWVFERDPEQTGGIEIKLSTPLAADDRPNRIVLSVNRAIPIGAIFQVFVCNNAHDAEPIWEDCTNHVVNELIYNFQNNTRTATDWGVNVMVKVERNIAVGLCFVSSIVGGFD